FRTMMRVPRITGFPEQMAGLISIRFIGSIVLDHHSLAYIHENPRTDASADVQPRITCSFATRGDPLPRTPDSRPPAGSRSEWGTFPSCGLFPSGRPSRRRGISHAPIQAGF